MVKMGKINRKTLTQHDDFEQIFTAFTESTAYTKDYTSISDKFNEVLLNAMLSAFCAGWIAAKQSDKE